MDNNSAETARLLEQIRAGDQAALNEIFARHRPRLRRMVDLRLDRRLHAQIDESDVVQEAYVDAITRLAILHRTTPFLLLSRERLLAHRTTFRSIRCLDLPVLSAASSPLRPASATPRPPSGRAPNG